jgi:hypothetical protein
MTKQLLTDNKELKAIRVNTVVLSSPLRYECRGYDFKRFKHGVSLINYLMSLHRDGADSRSAQSNSFDHDRLCDLCTAFQAVEDLLVEAESTENEVFLVAEKNMLNNFSIATDETGSLVLSIAPNS